MNDFEAIIASLGEHSVDYLGRDSLSQLVVRCDSIGESARIEIWLTRNTWDEQSRAVSRMPEIRRMFLDEISIDYVFMSEDAETEDAASRSDFAYA